MGHYLYLRTQVRASDLAYCQWTQQLLLGMSEGPDPEKATSLERGGHGTPCCGEDVQTSAQAQERFA